MTIDRGMWLLLALWAALPASARAEQVILLPHGGDAELEGPRQAAHDALRAALSEDGGVVSDIGTPSAKQGSCAQVTCAAGMLAQREADLAAAVAVWRGAAGVEVHVTLVDAEGHRFSGVAETATDDAADGARQALVEAQGLRLLGPGPWVRIDGSPAGARVAIDGRFVGLLPYRGALSAGDHQLRVEANGYAREERELHVPLDSASTLHVELALPPEDAPPGGVERAQAVEPGPPLRREPSDTPSGWNYVLGGVLIAGGLALATIEPVQAAARDGECVDAACDRVYRFGTRSALQMAAGAALAGAGVTVLIWCPLRVEGYATADSARVRLRGRF